MPEVEVDIAHGFVELDERTKIHRHGRTAMRWPEVELLMYQLGDRALTELEIVDTTTMDPDQVLEDLRVKYGEDAVGKAFPGMRPRLPLQAPHDIPRHDTTKPPKAGKRRMNLKPAADTAEGDGGLAETVAEGA